MGIPRGGLADQQADDRVYELINGFESPHGLEVLTTVHWAAEQEGSRDTNEAVAVVRSWTERKRLAIRKQHVDVAWKRLEAEGWIDPANVAVH